MERLRGHPGRVAIVGRVRLERQAALAAVLAREDRPEDPGAADAHLLDERPRDLDLGPGRMLHRELADAGNPVVLLLLHHLTDDDRVRGGAGAPARDGVVELGDGARVVPVVGLGRVHHPLERTLDLDERHADASSSAVAGAAVGAAGFQSMSHAWSGSIVKCQARVGPAMMFR